ncbi:MAG TPA: hypothetical protein VLA36_05575 [Longimicrobiales bacterium]|nr:hypothetical protein [Longimicrobiales bacterium]
MTTYANRKGFALPAAIGALVIVGVLVTGGFYMARQEVRIGVASKFSAMAVNLAQSAANDVLVNETRALAALPIWGDTTLVDTLSGGVVTVEVTRLASRIFFVDASAVVTEGGALWAGATRRVGLVTRMTSASMEPPAALTTQGSLTVGGSSIVNGNDSIPTGWGEACDETALRNKPGLMIDDTTQIKTSGGKFDVSGNPAIFQDPTITVERLLQFGDMDWDDLTAMAEKIFTSDGPYNNVRPDSVAAGGGAYTCNESILTNFGDPRSPSGVCSNYFPIIYATGNLKFTGGYGQGIMLVEGDLDVQGGFEFFGPVFVKGELSTEGTGGHFNGGVVAANVDLGTSTVLGNALVSFSSCSVERAVLNNQALTKVRPLAMRGWVDLSAVINN